MCGAGGGAGRLTENAATALTVYLPYAAGAAGQKVRLQLSGAGAAALDVYQAGARLGSGAGEFELTVAPGARSASVLLTALRDVDVDETLSLSATLLDSTGTPTHRTHLELELALDASTETPLTPANSIVLTDLNATDDPAGSRFEAGAAAGGWTVIGTANNDEIYGNLGADRIDGGGAMFAWRRAMGSFSNCY